MGWAHQKLYIFDGAAWKNPAQARRACEFEMIRALARRDCNSQNYLPFSDIFGICAKYLSPNLRLTNFDKPLMFAVKLGKLVWILADSYWLWGAILQPAWCIIIPGSPTSLCPVVAGAAWKNCLLSLKLGIIANLFLISFSLNTSQQKATVSPGCICIYLRRYLMTSEQLKICILHFTFLV